MTKGIYAYIDKKTNKIIYIGKDSYIDKRGRDKAHKQSYAYNKQQINRVIQNTPERYQYKVLEKGNISQKILNGLEMSFIQKYNPKFNFTKGGEGILGYKHSEKTKEKISQTKKNSGENKGENNPFYGKHHSKETRKKLSEVAKGRRHSKETRKKISEANNTSGYYRVSKFKCKTCKQGFIWVYRWRDKNRPREISSISIEKLEKKIKEKGLPWFKIEKEKQNERV